jgi:hemoglobin/transferrin/lactoferrin receptor protein
MRRQHRLSLLCMAMLGSASVLAEQELKGIERIQVEGKYITSDRVTLDKQDWQTFQASDINELFARTPSLSVGGAVGVAQKIYLNGLEDLLLNISLDGAIQSGTMFHHTGRLSVEPELLKRVEIQAGPSDATQGAGALGGSIEFVTIDGADMLADNQQFGGLVKTAYRDNGNVQRYNLTSAARLAENWSALASASFSDRGEFEDGQGTRWQGTEAEQRFGFVKLSGEIDDTQKLRISHERAKDEGLRSQRPNWQISGWNPAYPLQTERHTTTFNYQFDPLNDALNAQLSAYSSKTELRQDGRFGLYQGTIKNRGLDLRNISLLANHTLEYGIDWRDEDTRLMPLNVASPPVDTESARVLGLFIQDYWDLSADLRINLGVRFDDYQVDDMNNQRLESDGFSPNLGVSWQIAPAWRVFGGYSSALRGRLTTNSFVLDISENDPQLKAEEADHWQLGMQFSQGNWQAEATWFRTDIANAISDIARTYTNIGDVQSKGYNARAEYQAGDWQTGLAVNKADASLDGQPLNAYDHGAIGTSIGRTWTLFTQGFISDTLMAGISSRFAEGLHDIPTSAGLIQQPGYAVHDIYLQWFPQAIQGLKLNLTLSNLTDKFYRDQATVPDFGHIEGYEGLAGLPQPGRDIRLEASYVF